MTSFADNRQRGLPFEQMPARRRVSLSCDGRLEAESIGTDPIVPIEAPAKVVCSVAVPCDGHVEQLVPCPALANPYTDPLCDSAKTTVCSVAVPKVSPHVTDDEVDDAASARSRGAAAPTVREFFEGPSMFYNDGLNPLLPDRSEEPQRKRRRIKPGPVKVGQPDPHARFVALLWGPRKRL